MDEIMIWKEHWGYCYTCGKYTNERTVILKYEKPYSVCDMCLGDRKKMESLGVPSGIGCLFWTAILVSLAIGVLLIDWTSLAESVRVAFKEWLLK
jgi:hypothetical protein